MNDNSNRFSPLEISILMTKGVDEEGIQKLTQLGIKSQADFQTVKDPGTLRDLTGFELDVAQRIIQWALGDNTPMVIPDISHPTDTVLRTDDAVYCFHCDAKQPQDYNSGDLCTKCGKQAEPTSTCHWCGSTGPGKFCRRCGAEFVAIGELELAILLKNEGNAKNAIATQLKNMSDTDKATLWERARR